MKPTHPAGALAEDYALSFLCKQGLSLVERNWHCSFGELDLVMRQGSTYVFVEVKYRKSNDFGGAINSISTAKCAKIMRSAEFYLQTKRIGAACRVDAVLLQEGLAPVWLKNILG